MRFKRSINKLFIPPVTLKYRFCFLTIVCSCSYFLVLDVWIALRVNIRKFFIGLGPQRGFRICAEVWMKLGSFSPTSISYRIIDLVENMSKLLTKGEKTSEINNLGIPGFLTLRLIDGFLYFWSWWNLSRVIQDSIQKNISLIIINLWFDPTHFCVWRREKKHLGPWEWKAQYLPAGRQVTGGGYTFPLFHPWCQQVASNGQ